MTTRNIYSFFTVLIIVAISLSTSGCSTFSSNLVQEEVVKLEVLDQSNSVYINAANVSEKNNKYAVRGSIKRVSGSHGGIRGHVDVNVIGPDGKLLAEKTVLPRPRHAHPNVRTSQFTAYLDTAPPVGSVIQVAVHSGIHL